MQPIAEKGKLFLGNHPNEDYGWKLQRRLRSRLEEALFVEPSEPSRDAVVISYWWD